MALNVGQDLESQSVFIADGVKGGNRWTVLALDTKEKTAYYGDSLSWDIPCNLTHMVEPLLSKLGIELKFYDVKPMQSNVKKDLINLYPFYPTQACSNVCGVIVRFAWQQSCAAIGRPGTAGKTRCLPNI